MDTKRQCGADRNVVLVVQLDLDHVPGVEDKPLGGTDTGIWGTSRGVDLWSHASRRIIKMQEYNVLILIREKSSWVSIFEARE